MPSFDRRAFYREVGVLLARHRKARGVTQEEFAAVLGMPRSSYANIERGRQRTPADVLWRAALYLRVGFEELLPRPVARAASGPTASGTAVSTPSLGRWLK